jgi:hypothetical protein
MPNDGGDARMPRRDALKVLGGAPAALASALPQASPEHAHAPRQTAGAAAAPYQPKFFSEREWKSATALCDTIIPKDERSGSASEAGAVAYIDEYCDFFGEEPRTRVRGGLAWLDRECSRRFSREFVECSPEQRAQILDLIAWPEKQQPEYSHAVDFFNFFRDLTATGFYTSKIGIADLGYLGNRPFPWQGCPD